MRQPYDGPIRCFERMSRHGTKSGKANWSLVGALTKQTETKVAKMIGLSTKKEK